MVSHLEMAGKLLIVISNKQHDYLLSGKIHRQRAPLHAFFWVRVAETNVLKTL
jgi:hypothetical protein